MALESEFKMDKMYFDENRGHVCAECAEDLGLEDLPEASNPDAECVICAFTEEHLAKAKEAQR